MPGDPLLQVAALHTARTAQHDAHQARQGFHEALVDAVDTGLTVQELAKALAIAPRDISRQLQAHYKGRCGCQGGKPL